MQTNLPALPKAVGLYGLSYRIELVADLRTKENEFGETCFFDQRIQIDADLALPAQWATLCHEVLHAIDFAQKLELSEATIHRLDSGLWEFIKQILEDAACD